MNESFPFSGSSNESESPTFVVRMLPTDPLQRSKCRLADTINESGLKASGTCIQVFSRGLNPSGRGVLAALTRILGAGLDKHVNLSPEDQKLGQRSYGGTTARPARVLNHARANRAANRAPHRSNPWFYAISSFWTATLIKVLKVMTSMKLKELSG
jgi:hypothetical protein